jgi:hypothetical protein
MGRLLVCRRTGLVVFKTCPGSGRNILRRVVERLLQKSGRQESEALLSAPRGNSSTSDDKQAAGPRGAREAVHRCRLPRDSANTGDRSVADTVKPTPKDRAGLTAFANSDAAWGVATAGQSSFSQLKLSVVQAKAIHLRRSAIACRPSSTLSNSTNDCPGWQRRRGSEKCRY